MGFISRRFRAFFLILSVIFTAALAACALYSNDTQSNKNARRAPRGGDMAGKPVVVCTIFPIYDWALNILGAKADNIDLILLQNNRADMHSYIVSVDDIICISTCDLFIYVGGQSDAWVDGALKQAVNKDMIVINLLETLGGRALIDEAAEGMTSGDHDHGGYFNEGDHDGHDDFDDHDDFDGHDDHDDHGNDSHDHDDHDHDGYEAEYDEHVWLSLENARLFCSVIASAIESLDSDNASQYRGNHGGYDKELYGLSMAYQSAVSAARLNVLLFGDRFPFRYLTHDYGISYFAAFQGCSAETEASFETIVFLADKLDELGLKNILVTESSDQKIAETIIKVSKDSDRQILVLDAMQGVPPFGAESATFLSIMERNLEVLKIALS